MAIPPVPVKTAEGQAELSSRQRRLSQRHRTVLFLVDGKRDEQQVRTLARQAGVPDSCFGELLAQGLIALPQKEAAAPVPAPAPARAAEDDAAAHIDIPLVALPEGASDDSVLPAVRTLAPESVLDSGPGVTSDSFLQDLDAIADATDPPLEEARGMLMRAVKAEAPVAGSLTLIKLRRARNRNELMQLLDEVESRIVKPYRSLAAQQMLRHVKQLLVPGFDPSLPGA